MGRKDYKFIPVKKRFLNVERSFLTTIIAKTTKNPATKIDTVAGGASREYFQKCVWPRPVYKPANRWTARPSARRTPAIGVGYSAPLKL